VSEGQTAVLGRAAAALRADREQIERGCPTHRRARRAHGEPGTVCPTGDGAGTAPVSGSSPVVTTTRGRGRRRWWSRRGEICRP
jgi:hypothetical protein